MRTECPLDIKQMALKENFISVFIYGKKLKTKKQPKKKKKKPFFDSYTVAGFPMLPHTCMKSKVKTANTRGTHLKRGMGMCGPQDPIFMPLLPFTRPPVEAQVHSQDPHLKEKCDTSHPKSNILRNYINFQLQKLKFGHDICQKKLKFCTIFSSKVLVFDENPLTRPHFHSNLSNHKPPSLEIQAAHRPTYQKNKMSCIPPCQQSAHCLCCCHKYSEYNQ